MMWVRLCLDDVRAAWTRPTMYAAAVLLAGLSLASMVQSRADLDEHRQRYEEQLQERVQAALVRTRPSGRTADVIFRAVRPPAPAVVLVEGNSASMPSGWDFGGAGVEALPPYPAQGARLETAVSLDFEGIVLVFGGLISVGIGLHGVLRDRRSNWSRALRILPLPWRAVILGRLVGGSVTVAAMVALWFAIVAVALGAIEPASAPSLRWTLLGLYLPTIVYYLMFHAVGVAAACWTRSSTRAVAMGMAAWLSFTFVLPLGLAVLARTVVPRTTRHAIERERREAYEDHYRLFEEDLGRIIIARVPEGPQLLDLADIDEPIVRDLNLDATWLAGVVEGRRIALQFDAEWDAHVARRQKFQDVIVAVSPASALTVGLAELAGVGWSGEQAWYRAARLHHATLAKELFDDRPIANAWVPVGQALAIMALRRHPPKTFSQLSAFPPPDVSARTQWRAAAAPIGWLLLHLGMALVCAYAAGLRDMRRGATALDDD